MSTLARSGVLAAALICCWLACGCSTDPNRQRQRFYDKGVAYLKEGKTNEAALAFMNALKQDPKSAEVANVLAELEFRRYNYARAYSLLRQAVASRPDYIPAHRGLGRMYRLTGKFDEAQKEFGAILEHNPDDIDALLNLGAIQARQGQFKEAVSSFNRILEIQPNHVGALLALASVNEPKDKSASEKYLKLAVETNPRSVQAQLGLIQFYIEAGRRNDIEQLFTRAVAMTGNNVQILEAQAGFYEGLNRNTEAKAVIAKIQALHPEDRRYWRALAEFYVRIGDWASAEAELNRVLQAHKDDTDALHELIEAYLSSGDRKAADRLDGALLKKNPKDAYGRLCRGRLLLASGEVDQAMLEFAEVQHYRADSPSLHYWLAQAHLRKNEFEQARRELDATLHYDAGYEDARLSLAAVDNATGMFDDALANISRLLERRPGDLQGMLAYAEALIGKRDYPDAGKAVNVILARYPSNADAHRLRGVIYLAARDLAGARRDFQKAWELRPRSKALLEAVVLGYFAANQKPAAIHFLQSEIAQYPGESLFRREMGQVYLWLGSAPEAQSALEQALALEPADAEASILLAEACVEQNKSEPAAAALSNALHKHPGDSTLALRAGVIFERLQRWDDARNAYSAVLKLDNGNTVAANNLAWILSERDGNIDSALPLAQYAAENSPDRPEIMDTVGWIYYKKGAYRTAQQYLKRCTEREGNNARFQYHLGMAEWKLGEREEARRSLSTALKLDPKLPDSASARAALNQL